MAEDPWPSGVRFGPDWGPLGSPLQELRSDRASVSGPRLLGWLESNGELREGRCLHRTGSLQPERDNAQVSGAPPGGTGTDAGRRRGVLGRLRTSEAGLLSGPPANSCSILAKL